MEHAIHTTRPFVSGRSQAIRIPKDYRFQNEELVINRIGDTLTITPKARLKEEFFAGIEMLTDDFLSEGRPEEVSNERVEL